MGPQSPGFMLDNSLIRTMQHDLLRTQDYHAWYSGRRIKRTRARISLARGVYRST